MRILLTGASGQLGAYLIDRFDARGHDLIAWSGSSVGNRRGIALRPIDLTDPQAMDRALDRDLPDAIIHAAALSAAEVVRLDPDRALRINVEATSRIADWSERHDRRLVFTSTDLVFDGSRPWNREVDPAEPILAYGQTKRSAEPAVLGMSRGVVARLSLLYGPSRCGRPSFFDQAVQAIGQGERRAFFEDEYRTPLDLGTAAEVLIRLAESELTGLIHVAGAERLSRFALMRRAVAAMGLDSSLVVANRRDDVQFAEPRPVDVSMDTTRLALAFPDLKRPTIEEALIQG